MTAQNSGTDAVKDIETAASDLNFEKLRTIDLSKDLTTFQTEFIHIGIDWGLRLVAAIVILIIGWVIGNWLHRRFDRVHRLDDTLKNFLGRTAKYAVVSVSVITVIGLFGIPMASLLAVLGAAGLAIGLALQGTLANVASGVMLLILRPFNVGDYITWGSEGGTVKSLGLFGTELSMGDNVYVFAPNSKIWGNEIHNFSRNMLRMQDIKVGIGYKDDIGKAFDVILAVLNADERVLQDEGKQPKVMADGMGDFSIDLIIRFWAKSSDYWNLRYDMTRRIKEALDANDITIPFPTRTVEIAGEIDSLTDQQKKDVVAAAAD